MQSGFVELMEGAVVKHVLSIQSHVVYGCAGHSAAVFPLQRLGINVAPIHTVQYSNHTQYKEGWTGMAMPRGQITEICTGLAAIGKLNKFNALLSGYLGSVEQGVEIIEVIEQVRKSNPSFLYLCDPVMGHPEKGCFVAPELSEFFRTQMIQHANYLTPNVLELETLSQKKITCLNDVIDACYNLIDNGVEAILVKHLAHASSDKNRFQMLLASKDACFTITRELFKFSSNPVGVGDLISALFLGHILKERPLVEAFELCNTAVYQVLKHTFQQASYELKIIDSQEYFDQPVLVAKASKIN